MKYVRTVTTNRVKSGSCVSFQMPLNRQQLDHVPFIVSFILRSFNLSL